VHTHSGKAGILGRVAAHRAGVPVVIHTIHGPSFHERQNFLANAFLRAAERRAAAYTNRFISVADAMSDLYVSAGIAPRERFVTIYSGIEVEPFLRPAGCRERVRAELGIAPDELVVGKIARLFHLKGHSDVLKSFVLVRQRFAKARLLFVGDGILRERLRQEAAALGIGDRVIFAGLAAPESIPELIQAMDLLVHASVREGLARVLPQALLSGCPAVSYDVHGAREVIRNGETGFLVPAGSVAELTEAMLRALGDLPAARAMAMAGRERFADAFRAETMVRRIVEVYRQELDRAGAGPLRSP